MGLSSIFVQGWGLNDKASYGLLRQHSGQEWKGMPARQATVSPTEISTYNSTASPSKDKVLWSYVAKLQRTRHRLHSFNSTQGTRRQLLAPVWSLVFYLQQHQPDEADALSRAMIQSVRIAGQLNDYKLILQLVQAYVGLMDNAKRGPLSLDPRVLGEAIGALSNTTVSLGKIRKVWTLLTTLDCAHGLSRPVGPREVNVMMGALSQHGKVGLALRLYHEYENRTDSYSTTLILQTLIHSLETAGESDPKSVTATTAGWTRGGHHGPILFPFSTDCWQWNEAISVIEQAVRDPRRASLSDKPTKVDEFFSHVLMALLSLNEQAAPIVYRGYPLPISHGIDNILTWIQLHGVLPDVVSCTKILSSWSKEGQWKKSLEFLRRMQGAASEARHVTAERAIALPQPNVYSYSTVLAACARSGQYVTAAQLMEEIRAGSRSEQHRGGVAKTEVNPTTLLYNLVLQSLSLLSRDPGFDAQLDQVGSPSVAARHRIDEVCRLWTGMDQDFMDGYETGGDTYTFNTILSVVARFGPRLSAVDWQEVRQAYPSFFNKSRTAASSDLGKMVSYLMKRMIERNIEPDTMTFRLSVKAAIVSDFDFALELLDTAADCGEVALELVSSAALAHHSKQGSIHAVLRILEKLSTHKERIDKASSLHLFRSFARGGRTELIPRLVEAVNGQAQAVDVLRDLTSLNFAAFSPLSGDDFADPISICLRSGDFASANVILAYMNESGHILSNEFLGEIARAYADVAIETAAVATSKSRRGSAVEIAISGARSRVANAQQIVCRMTDVPLSLWTHLSEAFAHTAMFDEARETLGFVHDAWLHSPLSDAPRGRPRLYDSERLAHMIRKLHSTLLCQCARYGNVTAALSIVEDIQYFACRAEWKSKVRENDTAIALQLPSRQLAEMDAIQLSSEEFTSGTGRSFGLRSAEWGWLILAASKSGHWRVCLSTLQFLRPYLEALHPSRSFDGPDKYDRMIPSLTQAIRCMAIRGQYAWCERTIIDWMKWSGRLPDQESILTTIRLLASRGRGSEIINLLDQVVSSDAARVRSVAIAEFETKLYVGAITALHREGLYDDADAMFLDAVDRGAFPWSLKWGDAGGHNCLTVDLHGMNVAIAHSAVRVTLQQRILSQAWTSKPNLKDPLWDGDLIIVTGRGRKSAWRMRPILRPEVQRMLMEEFYPPLSTTSIPGNMGALRISSTEITRWLGHQHQQRSAQMLSVAAVLKEISSGDRLRAAVSRVLGDKEE
jgi:Smr domain/PPR repeat